MFKGTVYFIFNEHCISFIFLFSLKFNFCDIHIETPGLPIPHIKPTPPPLQPQAYSFLWSRAPSPLFFCHAFFSIKTLIPFRSSIRLNPVVFLSALLSGSIQSSSFPLFYPAQSSRIPFRSSIRLNPVVFLSALLSGSIQSYSFPLFNPAQSSRFLFRSSIRLNPVVFLFAYPAQSSRLPFHFFIRLNPVVFLSALLSGSIQSYSFPLFYPAQSSRLPFRSSIRLNTVVFLFSYPAQSSRLPFRSSIRLHPVVFLSALLSGSIQTSSFFLNKNLKNGPTAPLFIKQKKKV